MSFRKGRDRSLHQWVWLAYLRAALVPLLFVELALLVVYMFSHDWSRSENITTVKELAHQELSRMVQSHADGIEHELQAVTDLTELLRQETEFVFKSPDSTVTESANRYALTPDGAYYSQKEDGGAAVFFTGFVKFSQAVAEKVSQLSRIDGSLKRIVDINPLVVAAYLNTHDSLNRIWPYFDVLSQYTMHMNIPAYNFYYEADAEHNPERKALWIDAYLDPAGQGWMVSSIAPVYRGDFLEGVVGLDITLDVIIKQVLSLPIPWNGFAVLISKDGTLLAMPQRAEKLFNINELTHHEYAESVKEEQLKPKQFNLYQRQDLADLSQALQQQTQKVSRVSLGEDYLVASHELSSTGWRLVVLVPENEIFQPAKQLAANLTRIGWYLVVGLVCFYTLFFLFLYRRARALSLEISEPLIGIKHMAEQIGDGNFSPDVPDYHVTEFKSTVQEMLETAKKLELSEQQLVKAKELAEQANYAKGAFLANMSHEIRTPLNAVIGLAELAEENQDPKQLSRYLAQIQQASNSLLVIVNDILDFSKIDAGKVELENKPFTLQSILQDIVSMFINAVENKSLELSIGIAADVPPQFKGDCQRIRQVLINLVGNAVKFTQQGGIHIEVKVEEQRENVCWLHFEVQDSGIGIAPNVIDDLFKAFTQADVSISRKFGGTGLGLAICHQLIGLMGGSIQVDSLLGKGSVFKFTVPLTLMAPAEGLGQPPLMQWVHRALIIETNDQAAHAQEIYLSAFSARVDRVSNVSEALLLIKRAQNNHENYDLLLMDWTYLSSLDKLLLNEGNTQEADQTSIPTLLTTDSRAPESLSEFPKTTRLSLQGVVKKPVLPWTLYSALQSLSPGMPHQDQSKSPVHGLLADLAAPIKGCRILLVEDVQLNQQIAAAFLRKAGLNVEIANNGLEAIYRVKNGDFDAILMDLQMPVMGGFEATRSIRELPNGRDIPIIAMTAAAMQHDREACTQAGMSEHLSKPINSKKMIETLLNCILKHSKDKGKSVTQDTSETSSASLVVPGFDFSELTMLLGDDPVQLLQILNMFVEDFSQYDETVAQILKQGDTEQAHRKVHQLKGTAGNIGAIELHEICEIFDRQLKKGEIDQSTWQRWREVFALTLSNLSSVLEQPSESKDLVADSGQSPLDLTLKAQLIELNALLLADNYISNELIDSVSELAVRFKQQPCMQLVEMIKGYRYAEARQLLAKLLA